MKKTIIQSYSTGDTIPDGAIFMSTVTHTITGNIGHFFLVEI